MKAKSISLKKINKVDKNFSWTAKERRENSQIKNIRDERGNITKDPKDIKREIRDYYEQLYANKFDSLDAVEKIAQKS